MKLRVAGSAREFEVEAAVEGARIRVKIDGEELIGECHSMADGSSVLEIDGARVRIAGARRRGGAMVVAVGPATFEITEAEARGRSREGLIAPEIVAPMPGKVLRILAAEGEAVEAGQALIVLEAMKMETMLRAESPARVKKIRVAVGDTVDHGAVLIELSPTADSSVPRSAA